MGFWAAIAPALVSAGASGLGYAMDGGGSGGSPGYAGMTQHGHDAMWQFRHQGAQKAEDYQRLGLDAYQHQLPYAQNFQNNAQNFGATTWGLTDQLGGMANSFFGQIGSGGGGASRSSYGGGGGGGGGSVSLGGAGDLSNYLDAIDSPSAASVLGRSRPSSGGGGYGGGARPSIAPAEIPDAPEGATTYTAPEINPELMARFDQAVGGFGDAVEGHVLPTFRQLSEAAQRFSSPAYAAQLATQSAGDVGRAFNQTQAAVNRRNMAMGVNPNSGRAQEAQRQAGIENIALRAGAANSARLTADQVGFDRLAAAAQQGGMLGQLGNQALGFRSEYDQSRMNTLAGLEQARMGNEVGIYGTQVQGLTSMHNAGLSAGASMYGADRSAQASMYGADRSADASMYGSELSAGASMHNAGLSAAANMYGSDRSAAASMYGSNRAAQASMYGADRSADASMYSSDVRRDLGMGELGLSAIGLIGDLHNQSSQVQSRAGDFGNSVFRNALDSQYNAAGMLNNANSHVVSAFGGTSARQPGQTASGPGWGGLVADLGGSIAEKVDWGSLFS